MIEVMIIDFLKLYHYIISNLEKESRKNSKILTITH